MPALARQIATEAGFDPDEIVSREGEKPHPRWTEYVSTANARTALREGVEPIAPQADRFKNSPLKVVGDHDAATIAQMRDCMGVGNAVAGVICADGHLGYAQPVGGVIAYEKQISISGVGFDIGCGNMAVRLDTPFSAIRDRVGSILNDTRN